MCSTPVHRDGCHGMSRESGDDPKWEGEQLFQMAIPSFPPGCVDEILSRYRGKVSRRASLHLEILEGSELTSSGCRAESWDCSDFLSETRQVDFHSPPRFYSLLPCSFLLILYHLSASTTAMMLLLVLFLTGVGSAVAQSCYQPG